MKENPALPFLPPILSGEDKSSPLINRIKKNYQHLKNWAKKTETNCFRLYDAEIPGYPLIVDFYNGRFCLQYLARRQEGDSIPLPLIDEVEKGLNRLFGTSSQDCFWRTRRKSKETRQYEKRDHSKDFFIVNEYQTLFYINLVDYLDTGLFLDHRETRQIVANASKGKRLLNLFAYTCSFSVQAAKAGAVFTKSVDMSNTYTSWGRRNFDLNGFTPENHPIIRDDCMKFLNREIQSKTRYDVIVIDPPTISRSKKMADLFDVQLDHPTLITQCRSLLSDNGVLFFSTNSRKFHFDVSSFQQDFHLIEEITKKTIPQDFHDKQIHRCWRLS